MRSSMTLLSLCTLFAAIFAMSFLGCGKEEASARSINAICPIMGESFDPTRVPDALTREFKGQTVGFCCAACPEQWDELTDEQKQAKLDEATKKGHEAKNNPAPTCCPHH